MRTILISLLPGIAIVTVAICCGTRTGLAASGEAPWCIIDDEGNLHCWYASSEACLQQIAGGSRGFCVQNPSGASAAPAEPKTSPPRRKKR